MPYVKTDWKDRAVEHPNRYDKSGETGAQVTLVASPGTVTQAGTPINAANMNKIEDGIDAATVLAEAAMPRAGGTFSGNVNAKNGFDFTRGDNYEKASDPPGYYPVGETIFFANYNVGAHGFPELFGTVVTIKGYPAASCTQYFYPYLTNSSVMYRNGLYDNTWGEWRGLWDTSKLRVNNNKLELLDEGVWSPVSSSYPDWLANLSVFNDGVDGAFNPTANMVLTSGIYRFSSINIPAGVTITPSGSFLVLLVKDVANIEGTISASGKGAIGNTANSTGTAGKIAGGGGGGGGFGSSGQGMSGGNGGTCANPRRGSG